MPQGRVCVKAHPRRKSGLRDGPMQVWVEDSRAKDSIQGSCRAHPAWYRMEGYES